MSYWSDKVALVTGGSAGLGLAIAESLLAAGARVAIVGRSEERLASAVAKLSVSRERQRPEPPRESVSNRKVLAISADVINQADVDRMVRETVAVFGRIDLLVNAAGQSMRGDVLSTKPEDFVRLFDLNLVSMVRCTQAAAQQLIASHGHIVNIGSLASRMASRYVGAYPASKFPVAALSQQLRFELEPQGVHVLLVCPGPIKRDDAGQRYTEQAADLPETAKSPGAGVKLKGIDPHDLAHRILRACEQRKLELMVPGKARLLMILSAISPRLGDWLIRRYT